MKNPILFRYEFTDESGKPEGGDVFEFDALADLKDFANQILDVAHSDGVAVHFTIGGEKPFFGFLKKVGMSRADVDMERVKSPAPTAKPTKGGTKKAVAKKSTASKKKASSKKAPSKK